MSIERTSVRLSIVSSLKTLEQLLTRRQVPRDYEAEHLNSCGVVRTIMEVKMSNIFRRTVMASAMAIAEVAFSNISIAQTKKCIGEACPPAQGQGPEMKDMPENNGQTMLTKKLRKNTMQPNDQVKYGEEQGTGKMKKKLRKKGTMSTEQNQNVDVNAQVTTRTTTKT